MIDPQAFINAIKGAQTSARPDPVDVPDNDQQLDELLSRGQIFLSREEVFSSELIDAAFLGTDGTDLRGPLSLRNLQTAINLVNWQTTDDVLRQAWGIQKDLPDILADLPQLDVGNVLDLRGVWAQLDASYPKPETIEAARQQYSEVQQPRMISGFPANTYIKPETQAALRLWVITALARAFTQTGVDLRAEWWKVARKQENMSRANFERFFDLDLTGIGGHRRGLHVGMGGNFFKDLGRSISRLFKDPKTWLRNVGESIGRGLKAVEIPFQWMRDEIPYLGYALGGILPTVIGELGAALEDGSINTFNEQRVVFITGMNLYTGGMILAAIGSVLTVLGGPLAPIGMILAGIGALCIAVGRAILQFQSLLQQARLDKLNAKLNLVTPGHGSLSGGSADTLSQRTGSGSLGGGVAMLGLLALMALGGRR